MSKRKAKDIALGDFEKGGTVGTTCTLRIIIIPVNILFGEGNGNLLQYSCLGNPMDRGAWQTIQSMGSKKSRTQLRD